MKQIIIDNNDTLTKVKLPIRDLKDIYKAIQKRAGERGFLNLQTDYDNHKNYCYSIMLKESKKSDIFPFHTRIQTGMAFCRPGDTFDYTFGTYLAMARAIGAKDLEKELLETEKVLDALYSKRK